MMPVLDDLVAVLADRTDPAAFPHAAPPSPADLVRRPVAGRRTVEAFDAALTAHSTRRETH